MVIIITELDQILACLVYLNVLPAQATLGLVSVAIPPIIFTMVLVVILVRQAIFLMIRLVNVLTALSILLM